MARDYHCKTDLKSFKAKFSQVVEIQEGIFPSFKNRFAGTIEVNNFEVWSGYMGSGKLGLFAPVVVGEMFQERQGIKIRFTSRLTYTAIFLHAVFIIISLFIASTSLVSYDSEKNVIAGVLTPVFFSVVGVVYHYFKVRELTDDFAREFGLERLP